MKKSKYNINEIRLISYIKKYDFIIIDDMTNEQIKIATRLEKDNILIKSSIRMKIAGKDNIAQYYEMKIK